MKIMLEFIKGKELSRMFFDKVVKNLLESYFPTLKYASCLIWKWSEVLWFDTEVSTDHDWWPRLILFVEEKDYHLKSDIVEILSIKLPSTFKWYSTHFGVTDENWKWVVSDVSRVHRIQVFTIRLFFKDYIDFDDETKTLDWLTISEQKLRTIKDAEIFHDEIGFNIVRQKFDYYPHDVWLYLLSSQWQKIGQEEQFMWRSWDVGDELGSKIIATRIVHSLMRLCFLMEKQYAPYSKWFGTAFLKLESAKKLAPILDNTLVASNWKERQEYLSQAYEYVAQMHNALQITESISTNVSEFYDRPYLVIHGDMFAQKIREQIQDRDISNLKPIGSINQITHSVDILEDNDLLKKAKNFYT